MSILKECVNAKLLYSYTVKVCVRFFYFLLLLKHEALQLMVEIITNSKSSCLVLILTHILYSLNILYNIYRGAFIYRLDWSFISFGLLE
jgi:hypothetical protein